MIAIICTWVGVYIINFFICSIPGRVIYWLFVFCVTIAFAAVLIAQFQTSFSTLSERASLNAILRKSEIMHRMDRFVEVFCCGHQEAPNVRTNILNNLVSDNLRLMG